MAMRKSPEPIIADAAEREHALDLGRSFIVQAPAGSGKTDLLVKRFLKLLPAVERPEEILAITFTRKAAAHMRNRVLERIPDSKHLGHRLRIQTIDALCASLTRQMPVLSRFGAQPELVEDASLLYAEAARSLVAAVEDADHPGADCMATLLVHLDNDAAQAEKLLAAMLAE